MTEVEDWSVVDGLANDNSVLASLETEAICRAICRVAAANRGLVTASQVREELSRPVNPKRPGAIISRLARAKVLVDTGRTARSMDKKNRNMRRRMPVWRVTNMEAVK